ncbi:hypothetical protein Scep_010563 [Stephania cephalantha]|uniref:Uncharacterized protein n=1 Tax=Stephania cephalantha TaxID=152367 RepID=A0AAP0JXR4_9MAGN
MPRDISLLTISSAPATRRSSAISLQQLLSLSLSTKKLRLACGDMYLNNYSF